MTEVYEQHGPFTIWAPQVTEKFLRTWFAPWNNRSPRFFIAWGWVLFFLLFIGFIYFVAVPMYALAGIWAAQAVTFSGQGIGWLVWGWWHEPRAIVPPVTLRVVTSSLGSEGQIDDNV